MWVIAMRLVVNNERIACDLKDRLNDFVEEIKADVEEPEIKDVKWSCHSL